MKFILGTKEKMTQIFTDEGKAFPGTIVVANPITVTNVRTTDKDGYDAVQVGFGTRREKNINKAQQGQFGKLGNFAHVQEFRPKQTEALLETKTGATIDLSTFTVGDTVQVSAISKGKGFQGGVKRHGFAGGRRSHGQKHSEREVGSIGATGPQRVFKGTRMPGRMGADRVTVKNLKVLHIDTDKNQIIISGAVPGRRGTLVEIRAIG